MIPAFTDPAARRHWDAYFAEVDRRLAKASDDAASPQRGSGTACDR